MDRVVRGKYTQTKECVDEIHSHLKRAGELNLDLETDTFTQDAVLLQLIRAIQCCIDIAAHACRIQGLPTPKEESSNINELCKAGHIPDDLGDKIKSAIGFRYLAVHEYVELDTQIFIAVINENLGDLVRFGRIMADL